ncbi:MAG: hypothetical protein IAC42_08600 [Spirochaetes bacterium]|uniref:Outer membrane protein beta-barrel domain-containing protein n=1 Tax=Candidatus Aphodenecus pullistercoris TaxID=2840669 RepID=A0A9D9E9S6_9SPIR|nr:hypothetical protein [Candidatus Aphodenecus pullistercoris]
MKKTLLTLILIILASTAVFADDVDVEKPIPSRGTFSIGAGVDFRSIGEPEQTAVFQGVLRARQRFFLRFIQTYEVLGVGYAWQLPEFHEKDIPADFAGGFGANIDIMDSLNLFIGLGLDLFMVSGIDDTISDLDMALYYEIMLQLSYYFAQNMGVSLTVEPLFLASALNDDNSLVEGMRYGVKADISFIFRY